MLDGKDIGLDETTPLLNWGLPLLNVGKSQGFSHGVLHRKLDVTSRAQAIIRTQELHLFPASILST